MEENWSDLFENHWVKWIEFAKEYSVLDLAEKILDIGNDFVKENSFDLLENRWVKWKKFAKKHSVMDLLEKRLEKVMGFAKENRLEKVFANENLSKLN